MARGKGLRVYKHDFIGQRFGKLVAIQDTGKRKHGKVVWLCQCDCGNCCEVLSTRLHTGHTKSCGCYNSEHTVAMNTTHGQTGTRLYRIWASMKTRCTNPHCSHFKYYGELGVTICPQWLDSFPAFREWALSHGYAEHLTLDRVDPFGNYSPENCRWATMHEQRMNQRRMKNRCTTKSVPDAEPI